MPVFLQHTDSACRYAVWKITETPEELLALLPDGGSRYREAMTRFSSPSRRLEWMAVRVLLYTLTGEEKDIDYHPSGKPFLRDASAAISISHTRGYAAVLLNDSGVEMGIDIEQFRDRVRKVASRFMRADEPVALYQGTDLWSLLLHWSAKESIFKCLNAEEVDFLDHLRISPFQPEAEGDFSAAEYRTGEGRIFTIHYRLFPDFVLTVCTAVLDTL